MEFLGTIKADVELRAIPVVVLTSSEEAKDINDCYHLGANSYVVKPVDFKKFMDALGTLGVYWLQVNVPPHQRQEKRLP